MAQFNIGEIEYVSVLTGRSNQELGFEGTGQSRINLYNLPEKLKDNGMQNLCKGTVFLLYENQRGGTNFMVITRKKLRSCSYEGFRENKVQRK